MTAYVVLGLVGARPLAGYEMARFAARSIAHMWPIAKSQVYTELGRLEELGLIRGTDVAQERLPDKRVYELTGAGREALRAWILDDSVDERFRSSTLTKLFFAASVETGAVSPMLDALEERTRARRDHLDGIATMLAGREPAFFPRLTALFGVRQAEATLAWVDEARALLAGREATET